RHVGTARRQDRHRAGRRAPRGGDRRAEGCPRSGNPGEHLRARPDLRCRDHGGPSCEGEDDADHAALPGRRVDAGRGRAQGRRGAGDRRCRGGAGLGSALGPAENVRRGAAGAWNAMSAETKIRARPAAVTLTPAAEARVTELMTKAPAGAIGVKLSTPRRGCSGLAYSVDYVTEEAKFDEKIETPGGVFYIDGASVLYLVGSTIDWVEDDFAAGFVFENPNAKGACGCGESFTV